MIAGTARGHGAAQIPELNLLFVLFYVQATARYRLNTWAANADERLAAAEPELLTGLIHIDAATMTPALVALNAAGFRNAAGNGAVTLNAAGGPRTGEVYAY